MRYCTLESASSRGRVAKSIRNARIELSAGPGNKTGRDRDSWLSEAGILVLVSDRPRSRPYKKPRHAANATATAPTGRYNTITRNRPLFRPSHGCSIRPIAAAAAADRPPTIEQSNSTGVALNARLEKAATGDAGREPLAHWPEILHEKPVLQNCTGNLVI